MTLPKPLAGIKRLIIRLLVYFLPRPRSAPEGSEVVTEAGIRRLVLRLFFFLVGGMCLSGVFNALRQAGVLLPMNQIEEVVRSNPDRVLTQPVYYLSLPEGMLFALGVFYFVMMPFLRYIYKWLKVTGAIYAIAVGFILAGSMSFEGVSRIGEYFFAALSTAILSLLPLYLLKYKNLMLPKHLAHITYIAFAVVTVGGSVVEILNQIPYFAIMAGKIIDLSKYDEVKVAGSGAKVIIAFLFMFLAYDRMRDYSQRKVSKKYEWLVAFTGFYTICIIILKISNMFGLII